MSDVFFSLVAQYGAAALALTTFLSCLALPVPASLVMLAAGGFIAGGDIDAASAVAAAFAGAMAGDQLGYAIGRKLGPAGLARLARRPRNAALLNRAATDLKRRGTLLVFLSRWLFSPLGPYVNIAAGATALSWRRFTLGDIAGEAVWVGLYVGLGAAFTENITLLADLLGNLSGLLAAIAVMSGAGVWLLRAARQTPGAR